MTWLDEKSHEPESSYILYLSAKMPLKETRIEGKQDLFLHKTEIIDRKVLQNLINM